jgi:uncharacterized membrane protein YidH (DUF202 family)
MNKDTEKFLYENWFKLVLTFIALLALGIYAYQTLIVLPKEKAETTEIDIKKKQNLSLLLSILLIVLIALNFVLIFNPLVFDAFIFSSHK